jgi:hypothetical protein
VDLLGIAQTALSTAQTALPGVGRYLLAGGPELALVCHQVAVYPAPITTRRLGAACAYAVVPQVVVVYAKDCYPVIQTSPTVEIPDAAEVTDWTEVFMTAVATLYDALLGAAIDGDFGGDCDSVTVEAANFAGPRGGVCSVRIPITVSPT